MKLTRALCLAVALLTVGTAMAEMITKSLRIRLRDGKTLTLDLSEGQEDGRVVLPVMTFTPTSMKIELPPKTNPEAPEEIIAPATYTFEVEDLKGMEPIGVEQELKSGIAQTFAPADNLNLAFTGPDEVTVSGRKDLSASQVALYDLSGRSLPAVVNDSAEGRLVISLASLQPGVYIIKIDSATLKVTKR